LFTDYIVLEGGRAIWRLPLFNLLTLQRYHENGIQKSMVADYERKGNHIDQTSTGD
jgi:hypothetical protein